jgi:hypothetical protein
MPRGPHKNREQILRDLANFGLSTTEIARKNKASESLVCSVGRENLLSMMLRAQIIRDMAKIYSLEKSLRRKKVRFLSGFPADVLEELKIPKD